VIPVCRRLAAYLPESECDLPPSDSEISRRLIVHQAGFGPALSPQIGPETYSPIRSSARSSRPAQFRHPTAIPPFDDPANRDLTLDLRLWIRDEIDLG
jgi:hypothetical protein